MLYLGAKGLYIIRILQAGKTLLSWPQSKCMSIEIGHLFSMETALTIHEKGFFDSKATSDCKEWKIWNILCLQRFNLAPKMGRPHSATRSSIAVARYRIIVVSFWTFWTKYAVPRRIKPRIFELSLRRSQRNLELSLFLLAVKKKTIIVMFQ